MAKKNKGKVYEFCNGIYKRPLWVIIGGSVDDVKAMFLNNNQEEIRIDRGDIGAWSCNVVRKEDYRYGVVVYFPNRKDMTMNFIAHEATHVLAYFCEAYELNVNCGSDNEHLAYFMGWICDCINKARCDSIKPINNNNKKKSK